MPKFRARTARNFGKVFLSLNEKKTIDLGVMDKNEAVKLCNPLFYLPLQVFENMNKKSAFIVVVK